MAKNHQNTHKKHTKTQVFCVFLTFKKSQNLFFAHKKHTKNFFFWHCKNVKKTCIFLCFLCKKHKFWLFATRATWVSLSVGVCSMLLLSSSSLLLVVCNPPCSKCTLHPRSCCTTYGCYTITPISRTARERMESDLTQLSYPTILTCEGKFLGQDSRVNFYSLVFATRATWVSLSVGVCSREQWENDAMKKIKKHCLHFHWSEQIPR